MAKPIDMITPDYRKIYFAMPVTGFIQPQQGFVNGMVASHLLCHSGTINRHSLNGALLS
ncbi:hypothetical protein AL806_004458 [Salmonella enterica subsp. enterica]|nr:hypothetical protein [Salmonella enterica subsp. enterica]